MSVCVYYVWENSDDTNSERANRYFIGISTRKETTTTPINISIGVWKYILVKNIVLNVNNSMTTQMRIISHITARYQSPPRPRLDWYMVYDNCSDKGKQ